MINSCTDFDKFLVSEYLKYGSINKVYSIHHFNLPISFASYHRVLNKFKVIKSAGPNSQLSESLNILSKISSYKIPLERVYHQYAPRSIQVSTNTLHRILHYTRLGLTRRQGTALLITEPDHPLSFLTGVEKNTPNSALGKRGDITLPMGHSKIGESPQDAIARVLQQEVFTDQTVAGTFPWKLVPKHPQPTMYINIADIKVTVYHLILDHNLPFSSFKLNLLKYRSLKELLASNLRPGVEDILRQKAGLLKVSTTSTAPEFSSKLNLVLLELKNS